VTGKFDTNTQSGLKTLIEKNGGSTANSVTQLVTHLVASALGTAKADKARELGLPIVSEQWVLDSIAQGEPADDGFL